MSDNNELRVILKDRESKYCNFHGIDTQEVSKVYDVYSYDGFDGGHYVPACQTCLIKLLKDKGNESGLYVSISSIFLVE
jgi:hypothetical protein